MALRYVSLDRAAKGFFFTDWILVRLAPGGRMLEFVGDEVQAIDTTGNYNGCAGYIH